LAALSACGEDASEQTQATVSRAEVVENYAALVYANYAEALLTAERMDAALAVLVPLLACGRIS
jgi:uncharacterized iron-regulated protein